MTQIPVAAGELVGLDYMNEVARAHWRKTTAKTVNTTTAATDLLNGEITIDASAMGSTRCLRLKAWGDYKQNSGGSTNAYRFQLIFGATTLFDTGAPVWGLGNSATRMGWSVEAWIMNSGASNSQKAFFQFWWPFVGVGSGALTAFTTGEGMTYSTNSWGTGQAYNTSAEDTTASKALVLNTINPSASANCEIVLTNAIIEVV